MKIIKTLTIFIAAIIVSGCANKNPSIDSGLARYDYQQMSQNSRSVRSSIVSITDKTGKELYNVRNRSALSMALSIDVPAGEHKVVFVCGFKRYRDTMDSPYWKGKHRVQTVKALPGDYISFYQQDKSTYGLVRIYVPLVRDSMNIISRTNEACSTYLRTRHAKK